MARQPAVRVLLAEDSSSDAHLLRENLGQLVQDRFDVTHVERLADAMAELRRSSYDVVLLDLTPPDSAGSDTFSRIQNLKPQVPVVVLTGISDESLAIEALRNGVQDYLIKGQADGRQVARAIRNAIERRRLEDVVRKSEEKYHKLADSRSR